ncbi:MAG TPA: polysaccharide deacetylase family protein [Blastocatellia bacterium]|nr:polysaccharide deacetylase family protein [Blastocatellia bacterium]
MKIISLMYHDVVDGPEHEASGFPWPDAAIYKLDRGQFAAHLDTIDAAVKRKPSTAFGLPYCPDKEPPFLLTFDDGGASAYTSIASSLEERGWRGHFFVTTDFIDTPAFLTSDQIRDIHARGHVIGTHSCSHPTRMARCDWDRLKREWGDSVKRLSDILGYKVITASVPGGHYSRKVAEAAALAGVEILFTSEPTTGWHFVDNCLVLGRYTVHQGTSPAQAAAIASGRVGPRLRQLIFWNAKKITKAVGGEYYLKVRKSLLWQE